jgi:hypothetical protein
MHGVRHIKLEKFFLFASVFDTEINSLLGISDFSIDIPVLSRNVTR